MSKASNKCNRLRAQLQRRLEKGPPALGTKAWRSKNMRLIQQAQAACQEARAEDAAVLDEITGDLDLSAGLQPAGFGPGGVPAASPTPGLTSGEVARYGAIGLAVAASVVGVTLLATR